ncbi:hypothetical protein [Myroides odoratus]|uniref:hypothetical protein n=1 Tax=Myroides odoratus TaxID=256 RepID=UPI00334207A4
MAKQTNKEASPATPGEVQDENKTPEGVDVKAQEEKERKEKEEADRLAQEEKEQKKKEEAERLAQEEQARKEKEEADRLAQEEKERKEKEEAEAKERVALGYYEYNGRKYTFTASMPNRVNIDGVILSKEEILSNPDVLESMIDSKNIFIKEI